MQLATASRSLAFKVWITDRNDGCEMMALYDLSIQDVSDERQVPVREVRLVDGDLLDGVPRRDGHDLVCTILARLVQVVLQTLKQVDRLVDDLGDPAKLRQQSRACGQSRDAGRSLRH